LEQIILVSIIGLIAGVLAGMFGIGGGVIIVPALVLLFHYTIAQAGGTSLAALMMPVGIFAAIQYYKRGLIDIKVAGIFAIGLLVGVFFGANFALYLSPKTMKMLYGVFLLWVSWRFLEPKTLFKKQATNNEPEPEKAMSPILLLILATLTGILSGLFGVGGGLVMVPIMVTLMKFDTKKAMGTSLAALLPPVALPGVLKYYSAGCLDLMTALILALGLLFGAYFGAKITIAMPSKLIKRIYSIFLIVMSINFIVSGLL
jgi:uncharacterized protein